MGYARAGFEVVGVDVNPQPHYPFEFHQADAMSCMGGTGPTWFGYFDVIHASPPCQLYTKKSATWGRARTHWIEHPDLVGPTRELLKATGLPYVIENVEGAPLHGAILLCGTMFGLKISKHRIFEANWPLPILSPSTCDHTGVYNPWAGAGRSAEKLREAQDTPWIPMSGGASRKKGVTGDLFNAIPPAYTEWIGTQLLRVIENVA